MATDRVQLRVSGPLSPEDAAAVLDLVRRAAEEDGVSPLSEHVMLHLRYGGDPGARNIGLWRDGKLAGYAHLDPTDPVEAPAGEMVVDPAFRQQGLGLALGRALVAEAGDAGLRLWAHGDLPAAARLAASAGFIRSRALWQMRRSLQTRLDEPQLADGVSVRTFRVGEDEDAWVRINHRAFLHHPEQGAWTKADLELREREPWFDPAGFFLAEKDGPPEKAGLTENSQLIGFHWTKIHGATSQAVQSTQAGQSTSEHEHEHDAIGEVYVVGVDPSAQGLGLGRALTLIGLGYLRGRGLSQVMLYVDEANTPAIRLYESLGFTHWDTDVMFSRDRPASADTSSSADSTEAD
jgi:mycothiol synthase